MKDTHEQLNSEKNSVKYFHFIEEQRIQPRNQLHVCGLTGEESNIGIYMKIFMPSSLKAQRFNTLTVMVGIQKTRLDL